ncbi:hypothetical protein KAI32_03905 [Candidatus Pacearchaeota archaeon]|nr:hypothetical protein [Candidatus Pacearchaeota archaeon]
MKKEFGIFILGMVLVFMGVGFVSAGISEDIREVIEGTYNIFQPFLEQIVGDASGSEVFLAKVLFLIIIFAIVWKSLEKITFFNDTNSQWVLWTVSIAVSIVSVRWFGDIEIVKAVLLPYSALGITLTAAIPFVLYFLIVGDFKKTSRKVSWILFIVVFIGLWYSRTESSRVGDFAYIYLITAGLAFLVLSFDGTIQKWKLQMHVEKAGVKITLKAIEEIIQEKNKLPGLLSQGIINEIELKKREKAFDKQIVALHK